MMIMIRLLGCFAGVLFLLTPVQATELTRTFLDGIHSYKIEDYQTAIAEFSKIADIGIKNGKLFYNLANAYLKNGDIGHAVYWYERALKLMPHDPDLKFNHEYALTLVKDEKEDTRTPILRVFFFWQQLLSADTIQWAALIFNALFWLIVALQVIWRQKILKLTGHVILGLSLVCLMTAFFNYYSDKYRKQAVMLYDKVSVRSGLAEDSTELFVLHAGTKVKIDKENRDFCRIYFSDGKIGWVKKSGIGII